MNHYLQFSHEVLDPHVQVLLGPWYLEFSGILGFFPDIYLFCDQDAEADETYSV